jgi:hypothetical protein
VTEYPLDLPEDDDRLADLTETLADRLQAGDPIEAELPLDPDHGRSVRALLPTIRDLVDLGRAVPRRRPNRPPSP